MPDRSVLIRSAIALAALVASTALYADPTVTGMQLVSEKRISRTVFDYTYKVTIQNDATARQDVMAQVAAVGAGTSIQDGAVTVGSLTANQQVSPADTVTLRHDRLQPFSQAAITWTFTGTVVPPPPNGNPPQGILVPGDPTASLATAMPDYTAPDGTVPPSQISTDPQSGARIIRTALYVAFRVNITVAEANAFLTAINGRIGVSLAGNGAVSVRIPDPGSLAALYNLIESFNGHPAVDIVLPDALPEQLEMPQAPISANTLSYLDHHLAVRGAAAWNARSALAYSSSKGPVFLIYDVFGAGAPSTAGTQISWATGLFSPICTLGTDSQGNSFCTGHGYHVAGIVAGNFGGVGAVGEVTGMYPSASNDQPSTALPGYALDYNLLQFGVKTRIAQILKFLETQFLLPTSPLYQRKGIVLNTSMGEISLACSQDTDEGVAGAHARLWLRLLRGGDGSVVSPLEDRFFHSAAAGNVGKCGFADAALASRLEVAKFASSWNAAALLDIATLDVPPIQNTLVVENRGVAPGVSGLFPLAIPASSGCTSASSYIQGNISAIGSRLDNSQPGIWSFVGPSGPAGGKTGTSMATPQVAGLAAYLWALRPDLTGPQVANRIQANARTTPCPGDRSTNSVIDAYATILSSDDSFSLGQYPARLAILDVAGLSPLATGGGDGAFDELDTYAFLSAFFRDPAAGQVVDYSRFDLNGDGFTGGSGTEKVNLDMSNDANGGSTYSVLTAAPNGLPLMLDESRVTDFDVLCYYVNSPMFPQDRLGLFEQQLQAIRALPGRANVTCTKPVAATITLSDYLPGWVGMPGTAMVDDLRATSKASFQAFGNNNCTFGERGGPIFSSTVDADAVFFGAWNASNVPAQSFPSINRRNCSSFVAYKNLGTNAQKLWINATGRAVAFTGFSTFDWEYQTRLLSDGTTTTCQVGVVPNSGNFSPTLTTSNCVGQVLFAPAQ